MPKRVPSPDHPRELRQRISRTSRRGFNRRAREAAEAAESAEIPRRNALSLRSQMRARARARVIQTFSTVPSAGSRAHPSGCTQTSGQTNNDPSGRIRAYLRQRLSDATVGNASVSWRFVSRLTRQKNVSPPKSSLWDKSRRCRFVADRPERDVAAISSAGTSRDIGSSDRGEFGRASGDARFE